MARSFLVLDIETVPDPDLVWDAAIGGFPPAPFHQVVALGVLWLDGTYEIQKLGAFGGEEDAPPDESKVLEEFADFIGKRHPTMVTFNGRRFDLPVLANRMLKHGVQFPAYYAGRSGGPDYRYRFSDEGHMDLADVLTDYGASRMPSLTALAQLVGRRLEGAEHVRARPLHRNPRLLSPRRSANHVHLPPHRAPKGAPNPRRIPDPRPIPLGRPRTRPPSPPCPPASQQIPSPPNGLKKGDCPLFPWVKGFVRFWGVGVSECGGAPRRLMKDEGISCDIYFTLGFSFWRWPL
ncbi:MAG: ribonuclease H-like domain-containing protein [Deltaproteobacteria bacterium]|nr:ribonuclease H-like domain-containing protein [Deltaproteobacteria bacterium]